MAHWSKAVLVGITTDLGSIQGWDVLVYRALVTPCGRPSACKLVPSPAGRCFLRHIGVAGFWVMQAVCQEAVAAWQVCVLEDTLDLYLS